jgi:hypothetical protein
VTPVHSYRLPPARRLVGGLALLLGAAYAFDAWQTLSMGRWHRPGAAIFPIAIGGLLVIAAVSVLLEKHGNAEDPMPASFSLPAGADLHRLLKMLAAFALYFLAMPVIGNLIASALFLLAAMRILSNKSTLRLALYAVTAALTFEVFFVRLLKVQMPAGLFRQWLF